MGQREGFAQSDLLRINRRYCEGQNFGQGQAVPNGGNGNPSYIDYIDNGIPPEYPNYGGFPMYPQGPPFGGAPPPNAYPPPPPPNPPRPNRPFRPFKPFFRPPFLG